MESENQNQQASNSERKQELELKKLHLEISELEKPWFKKPNFIVPLIGAMSSIFILWVTGFFNTKIESLSNKREILNFENAKLEERKNSLVNDIKNLRDSLKIATKPNLSIQVVSVSSEKEIGIQIQNNGTGLLFDRFKTLFDQHNPEAEPSTVTRKSWTVSSNVLVRMIRHVYRQVRYNYDLQFSHKITPKTK